MICGQDARRPRRKNDEHAQRIILSCLLWGSRTRTAVADHPLRQSKERSGIILGIDIDGLRPFAFGPCLEVHFAPSEEDLGFLLLDS